MYITRIDYYVWKHILYFKENQNLRNTMSVSVYIYNRKLGYNTNITYLITKYFVY